MVRSHETAEEIAQETFLRAFRSLRSFRREASLTTWLYRITMNLCMNELNRKPIVGNCDPADLPAETASPIEHMAERERQLWVEREIQELPFKQRSVLVLRVFREMAFKEIGQVLGCSANAAKVNYRHAIVKLQKRFRNCCEEL
jgi:RNA polymerase sigma-70 factor (ECF subfamily)